MWEGSGCEGGGNGHNGRAARVTWSGGIGVPAAPPATAWTSLEAWAPARGRRASATEGRRDGWGLGP